MKSAEKRAAGYFYGPVAAIRPYLFQKCLLLMIAADGVVLMAERGGRYGLDGFNAAHFRLLDAIAPAASPTLYVGVVFSMSLLALAIVFGSMPRSASFLLVLLYTYAWSMSRLDSYLHHYMVTLLLICTSLFPAIAGSDLISVYQSAKRDGKGSRKQRRTGNPTPRISSAFLWYGAFVLGASLVYRATDVLAASWLAFFGYFAIVATATFALLRTTRLSSGPLASAWAYRLLGATVGVIYVFTAVAKMDRQWCGGHTIRTLGDVAAILGPVENLAASCGIGSDSFWAIVATSVIPLELVLAASYFLAVRQDEPDARWLRYGSVVAWFLAVGLHLNNEMMNLSIQWFGYYMMFLATIFFMPQRILWAFGAVFVIPAWRLRGLMEELAAGVGAKRITLAFWLVAVASLAVTAHVAALPGAWQTMGCWMAAATLATAGLAPGARGNVGRRLGMVASIAIGGIAIVALIVGSGMRFDYYSIRGKAVQLLEHPDYRENQRWAILAFQQAGRFIDRDDPRSVELLINSGYSYRRLGRTAEAIAAYRRALEHNPNSVAGHYNLGVLYLDANQPRRALAQFQRVARVEPENADARIMSAVALESLGQLDAALAELRRAQQLQPGAEDIRRSIERLKGRAGERTASVEP